MVLTCDKYFGIIRKNFLCEVIILFHNIETFDLLTDYIWISCPVAVKSSKKGINANHQKRAKSTSPSFYFFRCGSTGMISKMSWERRKVKNKNK